MKQATALQNPGRERSSRDFDRGVIVGLLIGEGSFGGDGKQPQVTLRMHTRHEALFHWLVERFPRPGCTGPTTTAAARTTSGWLVDVRSFDDVLPLLEEELHAGTRRTRCRALST